MKRAMMLIGSGFCWLGLLSVVSPAHLKAGSAASEPAAARRAENPSGDEAALRALLAEFVRAFNAGDAPALAGLFTETAEVVTIAGKRISGRTEIEKLFAAAFTENPGQTIELKTETVRFLGPDAAVEHGTATITAPPAGDGQTGAAETTHYSAAYVKRDGKWLHDSIRDYAATPEPAAEASAHEHLKALEGLLGEWIDESDEAEVHTTCRWDENQSYLLRIFRVKIRGQEAMTGSQRVGWDPRLKQFRSWVFDSDGGFSEGLWSRDGDRWLIKTQGTLKDGRIATATNILTFVNRDMIRWASVDRTLGAEALPDVEEITLVRKPPPPRSSRPATKPAREERTQP